MSKNNKKRNKKSTSKKTLSKSKLLNIFILVFLFAFIASAISYFIMQKESSNKNIIANNDILSQEKTKKVEKLTNDLKNFQDEKLAKYFDFKDDDKPLEETKYEEKTEVFEKTYEEIKEEEKKEAKKPIKEEPSEQVKKDDKAKVQKEQVKKKEEKRVSDKKIVTKRDTYKHKSSSKPKLAIMIDDVSTNRQKQKILSLGYKVNMAILPPTPGHQNSAKIAQDLPFYVIHFPLQASSRFKGAEKGTLNITDSYATIERRVKQLRKLYPNARYTNNHTGSVFTQNYAAMDKLFRALKKYNFIFIDSRTTPNSVAKQMAKKYNMPYIVRNTFIDNEKNFAYIQNQLKKAIRIAKKKGFAIAIGHPYKQTIDVLKKSKHLLKDLELIYINELPYI